MTMTRAKTGRTAERIAAQRLSKRGWKVLERNARTRYGELDIVAFDRDALVFVEVKAGRAEASRGPQRPIHAIDIAKQRRVRRLATAWIAERRPGRRLRYNEIRFDAVGILFDESLRVVDFEHLEGAF